MEAAASRQQEQALLLLLEKMHFVSPDRLPSLFNGYAADLGIRAMTIFLADLRQNTLVSLPEGPDQPSLRLGVDDSEAGRTYRTGQLQTSEHRAGGLQLWLPMNDGMDRIGVLEVRTDTLDQGTLQVCRTLASLLALAVIGKGGHSDAYSRLQRSAPLKLEAEMAWAYMPPRTMGTEQVTSSAVLEPAYDLGGDAFDHSLIEGELHITVLDSMGHDLLSGLTSTVAMSSCRNVRRSSSGSLREIVATVDTNLATWFPDRFITGVFAHLDLANGTLNWINCGHPTPLLLRDQNPVPGALDRDPQLPLGIAHGLAGDHGPHAWRIDTVQLQPGDRVLLYTDGVTEAEAQDGTRFGQERFTDFIIRAIAAGEPTPEALRRLVNNILTYQDGRLSDDATILVFEWHPTRT
ncbi:PP2C family protein-serine/threonine phosphatase [Actinomadura verrucosospora]|uniref:Ser/Thr phosphatase n=1 Tax=Actinomadura verrucosospora TaxID=46165 RepID=A0A7D3VUR1_ACTVE|nr:PP2C family protein-serine/threonine phosphatase [Actinomadura verrucosospora]QKG23439.1 Ser/Thr phosphatase [Actinomadura verrucosospora]